MQPGFPGSQTLQTPSTNRLEPPRRGSGRQDMRKLLSIAALGLALCTAVQAQQWPQKPVTVIVPFPPGGSTDTIARTIAPKLGETLGQNFVVDNRPGATGSIGAGLVKRAAPDGHTMMVASIGVYAVNPFLQKNLS